jgi:ribosomal-protein-alanine N-acetyltransferase
MFEFLLDQEPGGFLVAEYGDDLVGYVAAACRSGEGIIWSIAVSEKSRGRGIGRSLMESELVYLSEKVSRINLQVSVKNSAAISLYTSLSFKEIGRIKRYYSNGDDAFIMSLDS